MKPSPIRDNLPDHLRPRQGEARMFENSVLERLSKIHPATIVAVYLPIIVIFSIYGFTEIGITLPEFSIWLVGGFFVWTLFEYFFHRFIFHFSPKGRLGFRIQFIIHGVHHQYPNDKRRLVMPVTLSASLALVFGGLFWVVLGDSSFAFFPGFVIGYLTYDLTHYSIHSFPIPKNKWLRMIWIRHHWHHFRSPRYGFGVSSPLWDFVIGTAANKDEAPP